MTKPDRGAPQHIGADVKKELRIYACKRHLKDLESCHARGLVWDTETAQRAIDFFAKVLKLNGGEHEGKPFNLLP